jgi:ferredoxin--NADP+ reductase
MPEVVTNAKIAPQTFRMDVSAPEIARTRKSGQFVLVRASKTGERIPLTIADAESRRGVVTLIYQVVGKTTALLSMIGDGGELHDIAGPLGQPTHIENFGTAVCIGGGIGIAPVHPIAQALKAAGNRVISILGARGKDFVILEDEMRRTSDEVIVTTDDGSYGAKGFVTDALRNLIDSGVKPDLVVAIGPAIMMKMVAKATEPYGVKTIVSLNTVMVDGTGMCGGCRVTIGGETKFVCVDGPEFDGHLVDFDEMMKRQSMYVDQERQAYDEFRTGCRLGDVFTKP